MSNPYRLPYIPEKKVNYKNMLTKIFDFFMWIFIGTPIGLFILVGILMAALIYGFNHEADARIMHAEHDAYVTRQAICRVHHAWYTPSENLGNLVACHRLSNHELFYVVQTTGMEMTPDPTLE
jgi:hypothetical protein